jgi:hypothetical protein
MKLFDNKDKAVIALEFDFPLLFSVKFLELRTSLESTDSNFISKFIDHLRLLIYKLVSVHYKKDLRSNCKFFISKIS